MTDRNPWHRAGCAGIPSSENLVATVEGNIEDRDGVLKITTIRIRYTFRIPVGTKDKAERAVALYADKCPAYQTVKDCIDVSWQAEMTEG